MGFDYFKPEFFYIFVDNLTDSERGDPFTNSYNKDASFFFVVWITRIAPREMLLFITCTPCLDFLNINHKNLMDRQC